MVTVTLCFACHRMYFAGYCGRPLDRYKLNLRLLIQKQLVNKLILTDTIMANEISKASSKNFAQVEIMTHVDLLEVNKTTIFGALSATITVRAISKA